MQNIFPYLYERHRVLMRIVYNYLLWLFNEGWHPRSTNQEPCVIFIKRSTRSRTYNHALALKNSGIQSILISQAFDYSYHKETFTEIHPWFRVNDINKIVQNITQRRNVIAVIGSLQPSSQTFKLLNLKLTIPLLLDHSDSAWAQAFFQQLNLEQTGKENPRLTKKEVEEEKYCFENVDGVIARSRDLIVALKRTQ